MINEDQQLRRAVFLPLYYTVISLMVSSCHIMIIIGLPCHGPGPPLALGSLGDLLRTHPLPIFVPAQWGKKTGDRRFVPVCVIVYLRLIDRHCLIFPLFQFCCSQFSSFFLSSNCGWMKNCCWWWEDSTPSSSCPSPSASSSPTCWSNNHSCPGWKENYSWEF